MEQKFCHLHVHTEYSPQDAPVGLKSMVEYAKELGYGSIAVTDHGTVASWVKFQDLCNGNKVKPIFGIEAYFTPDRHKRISRDQNYHLILLAKNNDGIRNLYRLSELAYTEGFYYEPRVDWELIEKYKEGVICTSACVSGIVPETVVKEGIEPATVIAKRFKAIYGDDFYLEIQCHGLEIEAAYEGVAKIADNLDIGVVGTNDVHYLRRGDWGTQEAMMALRTGRCLKDPSRMSHGTAQFYLKSPDEMVEVFHGKDSQAVVNTLEIMEKCNAEIRMGRAQLPSLEIPGDDVTEFEHLEKLSREGLKKRGKAGVPEYEKRLSDELEVIKKLREEKGLLFDRYFLIVADYVNWAWEHGIRVGVGRGSGAGSLILYCLRVTGIDPIPYVLLFERFLSEDRIQMPDIDIDFDSERAAEVYEYVCRKYGADRCARIGTVGTFHAASAIKSAYKVFDPGNTYEAKQHEDQVRKNSQQQPSVRAPRARSRAGDEQQGDETARLANLATKMLPRLRPNDKNPDPRCTLRRDVYEANKDDRIYVYDKSEELKDLKFRYGELFSVAENFEGLVEKRGTHAAGVLITEEPTICFAPQQYVGRAKSLATAFDMDDLEKIGGIKFDFLRTKVLSILTKTVRLISQRHGKEIPIDDLTPDDQRVFSEVFAAGETEAIFQFESDGMRKMLMEMRPDCFEDIIAANALYRPGPMDHIATYVNRKHGREAVSYDVPIMEEVLKPTYGIMVYQEQVMQITRILAGFTGCEADKVRKAMGKKKKDVLDSMKEKFLQGCRNLKTCSEAVASKIWNDMESFASYAFNKSHAAGYGYTAYQCAFLKTYYPAEFMASQLTVEGGDSSYEAVEKYEKKLYGMGIRLLPLDLNESKDDYVICGFGDSVRIRKGFKGVKGIGEEAYKDLVANQPFSDMYDFCFRGNLATKSDAVKVLVETGAFDFMIPKMSKIRRTEVSRSDILKEFDQMMKRAKAQKRSKEATELKDSMLKLGFSSSEGESEGLSFDF